MKGGTVQCVGRLAWAARPKSAVILSIVWYVSGQKNVIRSLISVPHSAKSYLMYEDHDLAAEERHSGLEDIFFEVSTGPMQNKDEFVALDDSKMKNE